MFICSPDFFVVNYVSILLSAFFTSLSTLQASNAISNSESQVNTVPSYIPCQPTPPYMSALPSVGLIASASATPVSSSSLLGQVPTPTTTPLFPPGATLLPAVLAYPTAYLPPTASHQGPGARGPRLPQPSPPAPLFYPRRLSEFIVFWLYKYNVKKNTQVTTAVCMKPYFYSSHQKAEHRKRAFVHLLSIPWLVKWTFT